jgi:hypothetical protein
MKGPRENQGNGVSGIMLNYNAVATADGARGRRREGREQSSGSETAERVSSRMKRRWMNGRGAIIRNNSRIRGVGGQRRELSDSRTLIKAG